MSIMDDPEMRAMEASTVIRKLIKEGFLAEAIIKDKAVEMPDFKALEESFKKTSPPVKWLRVGGHVVRKDTISAVTKLEKEDIYKKYPGTWKYGVQSGVLCLVDEVKFRTKDEEMAVLSQITARHEALLKELMA